MRDLRDPRWMLLKAVLLLTVGGMAAGLLLAERPTVRTAFLIGACVWGFSRAYYFAFYVIERYIDPGFRFAGIFSALRHLATRPRR